MNYNLSISMKISATVGTVFKKFALSSRAHASASDEPMWRSRRPPLQLGVKLISVSARAADKLPGNFSHYCFLSGCAEDTSPLT